MKRRLISNKKLLQFGYKLFNAINIPQPITIEVINGLVETSLRGVDSHGARLIPHYARAAILGRINKNPHFSFEKTASSVGVLDADHGFGISAGIVAMNQAIFLAEKTGVGAVAVKNSSHFSAAAIYGLLAAKADMIGLCFTHTASLVLPFGGKRPFLGTNPICFTAPIKNEEPFCLDMATSTVSWNKVLDFKAKNKKLGIDWASDRYGKPTINPHAADTLLPIAGYKGYGLALMVEILCSLLTGMDFGPNLKKMYPVDNQRRNLGHFFMAIDISKFVSANVFKRRMKDLCNQLRNTPTAKNNQKVMVPGDPEKIMVKKRKRTGIPLTPSDLKNFKNISHELKVKLTLI